VGELRREDRHGLFAVPVSAEDLPLYYEIIKNPIDLQTMADKASK